MQACDRCHARKTRCDRRIPQCSACEKAGALCVHADKLRQRNLPRGYLDTIEGLVKQLREENRSLRDDLAKAQAEIKERTLAGNEQLASDASSTGSSTQGDSQLDSNANSQASPNTNAFAAEVGFLTLIATGETRYLGSSSGLGLASLINTVINVQNGMNISNLDQDGPGISNNPSVPSSPADAMFPKLSSALPFIEAYFQHTHIAFPLLHRPTFLKTVDKIYSEPDYYEMHSFDAFVFDMVLSIGSSNLNRFEDVSTTSSLYFSMAQSKITTIARMPSLESLKVVLLVSQHGIFSNLKDTSASIWHLTGLGARMCFELGLHLEPRHREDPNSPPEGRFISFEVEMRKRCFWCLYNLDRIVSITLGRPVIIRDEEIDISLPSHLDDDHFGVDKPIQLDSNDNEKISPFNHIIRMRRLSGQILNRMYTSRQHSQMTLDEKRRVRYKLHEELSAWRADTERLHLNPMTPRGHVSSFLTNEWYTAVYNNAILLLYRPSPYLPQPMMVSANEGGYPELTNLVSAAKLSLESYRELHRKRRLNYSWITLHGIFIAGLSYIYGVGRLLCDSSVRHLAPNVMCIIEVTQACSHLLVAICERWNVSRRSCELFNNLSTNLIRDALNPTLGRFEQNAARHGDGEGTFTGGTGPSDSLAHNHSGDGGNSHLHQEGLPIEMGMVDPTIELDNILIMDNFREYKGSFDFTLHRDPSNPYELMSGS